MDTSRRAVESYWRSRMVDAVTSDEDKVAPVYKLEEICDLLRSSHVSIVKEFSEFILKRLDNKSPIVKQKALRLIKYAVGKSGSEFRREMQRNSVAVRNLFHYKGHPDPLKGDALNKAVRETAHETISAIFSEENGSKPAAPESINRRIEGFGNTNFQVPSNDNKSFLSEVVGIGSASIKQGISNFAQGHLPKKNENGSSSYRGPNLHRSLTMENENFSRYDPVKLGRDGNSGKNTAGGSWGHVSGEASESSASVRVESKTREEKLLETIVTSGGVRLQPTRDALHVFILEAAKMDAVALSIALEGKLQSPMWQVRMKALCVLEAILRKKEDDNFSIIHTYFGENLDAIQRCSESPQSSLREKANKVLSVLNGGQPSGLMSSSDNTVKREAAVDLPDLIDTGDSDYTTEDTLNQPDILNTGNTVTTAAPLMDGDWFGDSTDTGLSSSEKKNDDDPFADVSFHPNEEKESADDLFSGMTVGEKSAAAGGNHVPELFDMFGSTANLEAEPKESKNINDLMASFSIDENNSNQKGSSSSTLPENLFAMPSTTSHQVPENPVGGILGSQQTPGFVQNSMLPGGVMPFNFPPGMMMNPAFATQPMNYAAMASLLAQQQQYLGNMSNFQQFGNLNAQGSGNVLSMGTSGGNQSALPDIFQPNFANQAPTSTMNGSKKEDTRAFDFISDHIASARDTKRVS
ncbi:PREDICTED: VHS domain-containing protein At3g16270 [Camelina sativa]|uniref:VHS domain-containing protein At3g16270 n=1 Tax=Camelina sativa TaxID=90675 RepID=A0ABM0XKX9_CAMSA|nr:PREDICTED: VHS domain-containing protein At3g16270 [Camelina sativa]